MHLTLFAALLTSGIQFLTSAEPKAKQNDEQNAYVNQLIEGYEKKMEEDLANLKSQLLNYLDKIDNTDCLTTVRPTSGKPTSSRPTSGIPTSDKTTSGKPTSGIPTSDKTTSGKPTSGIPTSDKTTPGKPTSGVPTSGKPTSDIPTSGVLTTDPVLFDSVILSGNVSYHNLSESWIGGNTTWKICWRASRDGWAASTFHANCNYKKPTLTIVEVGKYVFGGYTTATWEFEGAAVYKKDPGSFIFSLRNKESLPPFKAPLVYPYASAIYAHYTYGPVFGGGNDFLISSDATFNTISYTNFGHSYLVPSGVSDRKTILAGTYKFTPSEVEVFYLP